MSHTRFLQGYYLGTPVFIILDLAFNAPVRVSFLESLWLRGLYYAICVGCGLVCYLRPTLAPWIGIVESAVNILLLILSVMMPIYNLWDTVLEGGTIQAPFTTANNTIFNLIISSTVLLMTFYRSQAEILRRGGGRHFKGVG